MNLRIIGDVHGRIGAYKRLIRPWQCDYSVQLGDVGFSAEYERLGDVDSSKHRFIPGNHDDVTQLPPHTLGDFGVHGVEGTPFFFVRGARSIDQDQRIEGIDWWREEELSYAQSLECFDLYLQQRPALVLTHDAPYVVTDLLYPSRRFTSTTGQLLQRMFEEHRPELWVFGHHHRSWRRAVDGTVFVCLRELEIFDYDLNETPEANARRALLR